MYSIEVNDTVLEFDGTIPIILNNPMFSDEISYSLQFAVKNTLVNRKAFGYINMPEIADNKSRELPCIIKADPLTFSGTLVITFQGSAFNCYFKQNGDFWSAIKDKYLKDLPFDILIFDPAKTYAEIKDIIETYQESFDYDFTFPVIMNETVSEKFTVKAVVFDFLNIIPATLDKVFPVIPFLYIRSVYETIFKKNGIAIGKSAFFNSFLRKLIMPNNYMINEIEIDTTPMSTQIVAIRSITNTTDPVVTTHDAHGLTNYGFIKLGLKNTVSSPFGYPYINDRIFQIEVVDDTSFKILNEDFSAYEEYNRLRFISSANYKIDYYGFKWLQITVPNPEDVIEGGHYYFQSDDYEGGTFCYKTGLEGNGNVRTLITWDNDHNYTNARITEVINEYTGFMDGTIFVLPPLLFSKFKEINPANHVPNLTIKDFLDQCKYLLGLIPFIQGSNCNIKTFKEIILSSDFEEISEYSQILTDIANPDLDGYLMKMATDESDTYYKAKLPVQSIDTKYTIKDAVATKDDLEYEGSETNDVRLVTDENSYYWFNKSFLNKDNNWVFLCYNLLDLQEGNGDVKFETKFSTLLHHDFTTGLLEYLQADVNCKCEAFPNDIIMAPRIIIYYGILDPEGLRLVFSSNSAWDASGNIPADVFSIRWEGENGIKEKVHKQYIDWQLNVRKDCIAVIQWPMHLLADFDFSKKYRIRAIDYLVKDIKFNLNFKYQRVEFNETELAKV